MALPEDLMYNYLYEIIGKLNYICRKGETNGREEK